MRSILLMSAAFNALCLAVHEEGKRAKAKFLKSNRTAAETDQVVVPNTDTIPNTLTIVLYTEGMSQYFPLHCDQVYKVNGMTSEFVEESNSQQKDSIVYIIPFGNRELVMVLCRRPTQEERDNDTYKTNDPIQLRETTTVFHLKSNSLFMLFSHDEEPRVREEYPEWPTFWMHYVKGQDPSKPSLGLVIRGCVSRLKVDKKTGLVDMPEEDRKREKTTSPTKKNWTAVKKYFSGAPTAVKNRQLYDGRVNNSWKSIKKVVQKTKKKE